MPYVDQAVDQGIKFMLNVSNKEENAKSKGFALVGCNYTWQKRTFKV